MSKESHPVRKFFAGAAVFGLGVSVVGAIAGDILAKDNPDCSTLEFPESSRCHWLGVDEEAAPGSVPPLAVVPTETPAPPAAPASPALAPGECPINGAMYSPEQQAQWETRRPLNVVIENSRPARPQSGLTMADVAYEMVAEGGVTRILAVDYCNDPGILGPVRSARQATLDMAMSYGDNPLYAHAGGSFSDDPNFQDLSALGRIVAYGWKGFNDFDGIDGAPFYRDRQRSNRQSDDEHTMYVNANDVWRRAADRGLSNVEAGTGEPWSRGFRPYQYKDDAPLEMRPAAQNILVPFWGNESIHSVEWQYDRNSNSYLRFNGGEPHMDKNNGMQIAPKVVVIMQVNETRQANGLHTRHELVGSGNIYVFMDGSYVQGTWERPNLETRPIFKYNGNEIHFNRGQMWVEIVGYDMPVTIR